MTVKASADTVKRCLAGLIDEFFSSGFQGWTEGRSGMHGATVWQVVPGFYVSAYAGSGEGYSGVSLSGEVCEVLGRDGLAAAWRVLTVRDANGVRMPRIKRIDLAWDGVPFSPLEVNAAILGGSMRSRCFKADSRGFLDSATGQTVTLGRRGGDRYLRVYNKRGPTRFELELQGAQAASVGACVLAGGVSGDELIGYIRECVDFVDVDSSANASRRELLGWWASFVGDVERFKIKTEGKPEGRGDEMTSVGRNERFLMHGGAVQIAAMTKAYGPEYVIKRALYWVERRGQVEEVNRRAAELDRWRGADVAGVPGRDVAVPDFWEMSVDAGAA